MTSDSRFKWTTALMVLWVGGAACGTADAQETEEKQEITTPQEATTDDTSQSDQGGPIAPNSGAGPAYYLFSTYTGANGPCADGNWGNPWNQNFSSPYFYTSVFVGSYWH